MFVWHNFVCIFLSSGWLFKKDPLKVCYGSLGCFSSRYPYSNTPAVVPRSPSVIGTKFLLTTLESHGRLEQITLNDEHDRFSCKNFRQTRLTKIIIHGYIHTVDELWVRKMVEELLKHVRKYLIISQSVAKPTKWPVRPAKIQISLDIHPVWSKYLLCAQWIAKNQGWFTRKAKTLIILSGRPGWSESSLFSQVILLVLSCGDSIIIS